MIDLKTENKYILEDELFCQLELIIDFINQDKINIVNTKNNNIKTLNNDDKILVLDRDKKRIVEKLIKYMKK